MGDDDLARILQNIDELFDADDMDQLSPSQTIATASVEAVGSVLEAPVPISVIFEPSSVVSAEMSSISPPSSAHSSPSNYSDIDAQLDTIKQQRSTPRRRRVATKDRIRALRDEVIQLAAELAQIKARAQARSQGSSVAESTSSFQPLWESIAARQLQKRHKAEAEKVHLRYLVESNARYLQSVRRAIHRQPDSKELECALSSILPTTHHFEFVTPFTFDSLLTKLETEYERSDDIWRTLRISDLECPSLRLLSSFEPSGSEALIEFIGCVNIPFRIEIVEEIFWKYLSDICLRQPCVLSAKVVSSTDSTIQVSMNTKTVNEVFEICSTIHCASRKFVEHDRIIVVTLGVTERLAARRSITSDDLKLYTTAIRILKRGSRMSDGSHATILESYWSTTAFDGDGETKCPPWKLEPFLEFGVQAMKAVIAQEHEVVEDLLVQMMVGKTLSDIFSK